MASRFHFALDPLLAARRRAEENAQREVARLELIRRDIEQLIRQRQQEIADGRGALRGALTGRIDGPALRVHAGAAVQVMRQGHQLVLKLAGVMSALERARQALAEAAARRRAIELLRERRYLAWRQEIDRAETAAIDDLAVIRAGRAAATEGDA